MPDNHGHRWRVPAHVWLLSCLLIAALPAWACAQTPDESGCGNAVLDAAEECDDGNARDDDCCTTACRLTPEASACWRLAGSSLARVSATIARSGRTFTCTATCRDESEATVILLDDGTYRWPRATQECPSGAPVTLPDEVGRRITRRGRTLLLAGNLPALKQALRACSGTRLQGLRTTVELAPEALTGTQVSRARQPGSPSVTLRTKTAFNGVPFVSGLRPAFPPSNPFVPLCSEALTLRCRLR